MLNNNEEILFFPACKHDVDKGICGGVCEHFLVVLVLLELVTFWHAIEKSHQNLV